jgi:hypothetical protein
MTTIKSHLSDALDMVSKALIVALEKKDEVQVAKLFELYNKVKTCIPNETSGFTINFNDYNVAAAATDWTNFCAGHDVISFGDSVISGSSGVDTISLG